MSTTATKSKSVVFSEEEMRQALKDGKGTFRRAVKPQPFESEHVPGRWLRSSGRNTYDLNERRRTIHDRESDAVLKVEEYQLPVNEWLLTFSPFDVGDTVAVKERWQAWSEFDRYRIADISDDAMRHVNYLADGNLWDARIRDAKAMPLRISRLSIVITAVDVQRNDAGVWEWLVSYEKGAPSNGN